MLGRSHTAGFWRIAALLFLAAAPAAASDVYQEPEAFLEEVFDGDPPKSEVLWLGDELQERAREILGHRYDALRVRYWLRDGRSAWILEEIGKERPITTGIVIADNHIERVKVLIYRESRGWEVRYPSFTEQFDGAELTPDRGLDRSIDGISGATLSVQALTRLSTFALVLHDEVTGE